MMDLKGRMAFLETRESLRYLDENEDDKRFFTADRTLSMLFLAMLTSLMLFVIAVLWNFGMSFIEYLLHKPVTLIHSTIFIIVVAAVILLIFLTFLISFVAKQIDIRKARKTIGKNQAVYPDIVDIAKEHIDEIEMPEVDLRTSDEIPTEWDGRLIEAEIEEIRPAAAINVVEKPEKHEIPTIEQLLLEVEELKRG